MSDMRALLIVPLIVVAGLATSTSSSAVVRTTSPGISLHVLSKQHIPHSTSSAQVVTAEAANGDVAIAVAATTTNDDIEIARVGHAPSLFATVPPGTRAMAFDKTDLFVAGRHAISSFDRKTGVVVRSWNVVAVKSVTSAGATMTYADGRLWVLGRDSDGHKVFEINPTGPAITAVGSGHNVATIAAGPLGVYFVRSGGHTLIRVSASGHRVTAPTHEKVNETLSGPAAVHAVVVIGKDLIVAHDAGQGFDAAIVRYNASTLAYLSVAGTNVAITAVVPTAEGNLVVLSGPGLGGCSSNNPCVAKVSTTTAKTADKLHLGAGPTLSVLLGPQAAIVVARAHHADLYRIAATVNT